MNSSNLSRVRALTGAAALAITLGVPSAAQAAHDYVVTLKADATTTCERALIDVTVSYSISTTATYSSALCGFSASLSKGTVVSLEADPRVESVRADTAHKLN